MKVITYKNNGKTRYSISDDRYIPLHHIITYYLQVELGKKSSNTIERKSYELLFILKYFKKRGIDLIQSIEELSFISEEEISIFAKACKLKALIADKEVVTTIFTQVSLRNLMARNQPTENIVEEGTAKGRFDTFIHFYKFVFRRNHSRKVLTDTQQKNYNECLIELVTSRKSMGSWTKKISDPFMSNFPDEAYFELLELVIPSNTNNPFSSKLRNELIIKIIIETGIRRGAVAKLKISDVFNDKTPRIRVTKTPGDVTDKRIKIASQKTNPHVSPISSELATRLEYYIKEIRSHIPNTDKHEFVFVAEKDCRGTIGDPLALRNYNTIFNKLSNILDVNVTPHTLRYKWNEIFDVNIDSLAKELNLDSQAKEDIRKYAMGWSANSEMANIYNNFRLAVKTREHHLSRQRELSARLSKRNDPT
jgi:integrase